LGSEAIALALAQERDIKLFIARKKARW